jgi:hypothetical protein
LLSPKGTHIARHKHGTRTDSLTDSNPTQVARPAREKGWGDGGSERRRVKVKGDSEWEKEGEGCTHGAQPSQMRIKYVPRESEREREERRVRG